MEAWNVSFRESCIFQTATKATFNWLLCERQYNHCSRCKIQNTICYLHCYFQMFGFDIPLPFLLVIICVLPWYKAQVKCEKSEPRSVKSSQNYVWQMIVFGAYYSLCTPYLSFLFFNSDLYLHLFIKAIEFARGNLCEFVFVFFCICLVIVFVFVDQGNCVGTRERGLVWRRSVNQRCLDCRSTLFHQCGFLYFPSYLYF